MTVSGRSKFGETETLVSKKVDLDEHKALLVVSFLSEDVLSEIGYFDEVMSREDFVLELQNQGEAFKRP